MIALWPAKIGALRKEGIAGRKSLVGTGSNWYDIADVRNYGNVCPSNS